MAQSIIATVKQLHDESKGHQPLGAVPRIISAIFMVNFVLTLIVLIFSSRDLVQYNAVNLIDWVNLVFEAVALWLIWKRMRAVRPFVMGFTAFNVIVGTITEITSGRFDPVVQGVAVLFDVFLFVYFWKSEHVKEVFTNDFAMDLPAARNEEFKIERWTWPFVRNIIIYFCVFSFLGHWMEMGFCLAIKAGLVAGEFDPSNTMLWRDWFYPFPMHGMAVTIIALALYPLWQWLLKKLPTIPAYAASFVINGLLCVSIEFVCGLMWNADLQNWDYSTMPFNFMGQICLQNGIGFAFASSLIAWYVYPLLERLIARVPRNVMMIVFIVILAGYMVPQTLYLVEPPIDYRTEIEQTLKEDDLTPEERERLEEDLAYLDYLDAYKQENAERIARERAEAAAQKEANN